MKILLVHNYYQQRGGEDIVFEQERDLLRRAGHQVIEYCRSNEEVDNASLLARIQAVAATIWARQSCRSFSRLLAREKPNVVHAHNTFLRISPSIYWACARAGVPVVQTLHNYRLLCPVGQFLRASQPCHACLDRGLWQGVRYGCYRDSRAATAVVALMLTIHRRCKTWTDRIDRYIALSNFSRAQFVAAGLAAEKVLVKPNFVYPDPGVAAGPGDCAVFVGRLSPEKGLPTLLSAWKLLRSRVPLLIVGEGPLRAELEQQAYAEGLTSVRFCGRLERQQVFATLKRARFLVFPSQCYENFPGAIAEAYACGVPVLASALGTMREVVDDGITGLLVGAADPVELSEKVEWAWCRPGVMREFGRAARMKYEQLYTADRNYVRLMNIYQDAIAARSCNHATKQAAVPTCLGTYQRELMCQTTNTPKNTCLPYRP
jgi:glycosyltransferase involved in cell wall biosynthesis